MTYIEGFPVPPNEGGLPLDIERDMDKDSPTFGKITSVRIAWRGFTIRQQFPWTRPLKPTEAA